MAKRRAFPKSGTPPAHVRQNDHEPSARPTQTWPILDPLSETKPLLKHDPDLLCQSFHAPNGRSHESSDTPPVPLQPEGTPDAYLVPMLTRNERQRLAMLWYHTKELHSDPELLYRIQEKVDLVKEFTGWDFAICGLLDNDVFERLVTTGIQKAIVPRRESPCSHTVQQPPGSVLLVNDMANDWRFKNSPVVELGLRSYAGTQLRCSTDDGEEVAIGSLCVASPSPGLQLNTSQQQALVRFSNMVVTDMLNQCRWNRQREQQRRKDLLNKLSAGNDIDHLQEKILSMAKDVFPQADTLLVVSADESIRLSDDQVVPLSEIEEGFWEDEEELDSIIVSQNHHSLMATRYVRAIESKLWSHTAQHFLVIATKDVRLVFDDVDIWFVEKCASVLSSALREQSLKEALQVKEDFLRGVTHQLRTPIHGVLGSVDLLAEELTARGYAKMANELEDMSAKEPMLNTAEVLRAIRSSGQELMSTVNNIIKLHRWAETTPDQTAGLIEMAELEVQIVDNVLPVIPHSHVGKLRVMFDNQLPPDISGIMSDTMLLPECLQSVVLNAVQATSSGDIIVTISTDGNRSVLRFDVEDNGRGISVADQQSGRIFKAYEKCDSTTPGVGLGLTLAYKMAAAMDGSITLVSSTEGKGSHFRAEFRSPVFAGTSFVQTNDTSVATRATSFHVIGPETADMVLEHFAAILIRSGFHETSTPGHSLSLVKYTPDKKIFQETLLQAEEYGQGICFVPTGEPLDDLRSLYPRITFVTGASTTRRLNEILQELRQESDEALSNAAALPLQLPANTNTFDLPILGASSPPARSPAPSLKPPHCLLVDDNAVNLRLLEMYCSKRKLPYVSAVNGLEAIQAYQDSAATIPVRLILLDLQMPKCDGLTACAAIRSFEQANGLEPARVVILTGQDSPNDRRQSMAAGANEFFVKPVSFKILDGTIARHFRSSFTS